MSSIKYKNVALNCSISTNATTYSTYSINKANDGNIVNTNGYLTDAYTYSSPLIITLDLGKSYKISYISLKQLIYSSVRRCKDFEIQASNDNSNFTSIITSVLQNKDEIQTFYLPKNINKYRYWNVIIKTNYNITGSSALDRGVCEIELNICSKFLLKQNNEYYTLKDNALVLLEDQALNESNFNNNGFYDLSLLNNIDKTDMKLLVYDESNSEEMTLKFTLKQPFRPIDKFDKTKQLEVLKYKHK